MLKHTHSVVFKTSTFVALLGSFLIALLLTTIPPNKYLGFFWPHWVALVLIYWVIAFPYRINPLIGWVIGLLLDSLYGNFLGEQAFAMTLVSYLSYRFHLQLRMCPLIQQGIFVFVLLSLYESLLSGFNFVTGLGFPSTWYYNFISSLVSGIFWPVFVSFFNFSRRKFEFRKAS